MGFVINNYKCGACDNVFEEVVERDEPDPPCPVCGGASKWYIGGGNTDRFQQNLYPYYNRGLGCMVNSKEHLRQLCKEKGVEPVEGDYDTRRDFGIGEEERRAEAEISEYDKYMEEAMSNGFVQELVARRMEECQRMQARGR